MAARSISSVTLSFGLVSIPVKVYSATESSKGIAFNLLDKSGSRLKQQYVSVASGAVVAREDMLKGYEFAKDQYVIFTPEELKAMEGDAGTTLAEISEFVPSSSVDPVYFDKAYYLAPDKGGAKPYHLVAAALRASGRVAIAKWAARGKQYVVMIRAVAGGLVMQQLLYAAEVRTIEEIEVPQAEVRDAEMKLAMQLIDAQSSDTFDASVYTDEVRARIEAAIQQKVEGKEITMTAPAKESGKVIDMMEALQASIAASAATKAKAPAKKAKRAA